MKNKNFASTRSTLIYVSVILMLFSFPYWWNTFNISYNDSDYVIKFYTIIILWHIIAAIYSLTYWLIDLYECRQIKWLDKIHIWLSGGSFTIVFFQFTQGYLKMHSDAISHENIGFINLNIKIAIAVFCISQFLFFFNIWIAFSEFKIKSAIKKEDIDHLVD